MAEVDTVGGSRIAARVDDEVHDQVDDEVDPRFDHVALFHDGPLDLADRLADDVAAAVDAGDAVMVCSGEASWAAMSARLGARAAGVVFVPDDVRYDRPATAMRMLHEFVQQRLREGAPAVWSIGAIPYGQPIADREWERYEAAVNDVLRHLPLKAVCTYDISTTPRELIETARRTHLAEHVGHVGHTHSPLQVGTPPAPAGLERPDSAPILRLEVRSPGAARRAVAGALDGDPVDLERVQLVVSELVTNGLLHGQPPVVLTVWRDPSGHGDGDVDGDDGDDDDDDGDDGDGARIVIDVADCGAGVHDPFFDLRPPRRRPGGAGFWIVGQLCDHVSSQRIGDTHHVTVVLGREPVV